MPNKQEVIDDLKLGLKNLELEIREQELLKETAGLGIQQLQKEISIREDKILNLKNLSQIRENALYEFIRRIDL